MYGTVAKMRLKPGSEQAMVEMSREAQKIPGIVTEYVYRMDNDSNEYYLAVVFASKEAYQANANSPEQHQRYLKMMEVQAAEPEWHDGEIVWSMDTTK